ncbi:MAG: non-heme iron oxygenase ferredoxin subunit [bacterium]|nr:non-heme iron oxygenase ferredoxin subunit [bacterium]
MSTESAPGPVRLCARDDLAPGEARCFVVEGRRVALARLGEEFFAVDDTCSHADFSLSEGDVDVDECALECPAHGSLFDLRTGEALTLPAVVPVATHGVVISDEGVFVTLRERWRA